MIGASRKVVDIRSLSVTADAGGRSGRTILQDVSLDIDAGEVVAVVGESGSGKSTLARAAIGLLPHGVRVTSGSIEVAGEQLSQLDERAARGLRGRMTGMVFQEPMSALNPTMPVGAQLTEVCRTHFGIGRAEADERAAAMLERVRIRDPRAALRRYPHEFSGGMRQRLMLAAALLHRPKLLIADEPTTALDVVVQRDVLELMAELVREIGAALLLVTHDLAVVAACAQRVAVLEAGRRLAWGSVEEVVLRPSEPHVRRLLDALPSGRRTGSRAGKGAPVLVIDRLSVAYPVRRKAPWSPRVEHLALRDVSLHVEAGETLAVIGESGSGKSSLARCIVRLQRLSAGSVRFGGEDIASLEGRKLRELRRELQIVFQDPATALDPRMTVLETVAEGLAWTQFPDRDAVERRVAELLQDVGLEERCLRALPHQLSGGQRQRVCIARALAPRPRVLIADEAVSALDLSVQSRILALLEDLQRKYGFACVFITHNLAVAERIADRIAVLYRGELVECGPTAQVLDHPKHPYTRSLLAASLELAPAGAGAFALRTRHPGDVSPVTASGATA
jgi:peptide/nickel transport system ATP-binding protein